MDATLLRCCRCKAHLPREDFAPSQADRKGGGRWCRKCSRSYYMAKTPEGVARQSVYQRTSRRSRKDWVTGIKVARGCADCGTKHPAVLSFHHRDPDVKLFTVSRALQLQGRAREIIMAEIEKCDVLCENCHRIRHWNECQAEQ